MSSTELETQEVGRPKGSKESPRTPFDAYLLAQKLSYAEVARRVQVSRELVRLWAEGRLIPPKRRVVQIAKAINAPEEEALKWWRYS